jgi:hypothetical protein
MQMPAIATLGNPLWIKTRMTQGIDILGWFARRGNISSLFRLNGIVMVRAYAISAEID